MNHPTNEQIDVVLAAHMPWYATENLDYSEPDAIGYYGCMCGDHPENEQAHVEHMREKLLARFMMVPKLPLTGEP